MKEQESTISEAKASRTERGEWHVVYTEKHGFLRVKYPPGLSKERVIRITVGELPDAQRYLFVASGSSTCTPRRTTVMPTT